MSRCAHAQARYTVVCSCVGACITAVTDRCNYAGASNSFYRLLATFLGVLPSTASLSSFAYFEGHADSDLRVAKCVDIT